MEEKLKKFLNSLSIEEMGQFWRFLRSKKWGEWITTRLHGEKL